MVQLLHSLDAMLDAARHRAGAGGIGVGTQVSAAARAAAAVAAAVGRLWGSCRQAGRGSWPQPPRLLTNRTPTPHTHTTHTHPHTPPRTHTHRHTHPHTSRAGPAPAGAHHRRRPLPREGVAARRGARGGRQARRVPRVHRARLARLLAGGHADRVLRGRQACVQQVGGAAGLVRPARRAGPGVRRGWHWRCGLAVACGAAGVCCGWPLPGRATRLRALLLGANSNGAALAPPPALPLSRRPPHHKPPRPGTWTASPSPSTSC
jgi:hypothetical protein